MHKVYNINNPQDWLIIRLKGIGGSDASCVLGKNPYKTNVELWKEKTGASKKENIDDKPCIVYGKKAEDYLRKLFELDYPQYEIIYSPYNIHINNEYEFLRGTFDGLLIDKTTNQKGFLEIKTSEIKSSKDWEKWNNKIPDYYYCQVLHYFAIDTDFKFCKFKAQLKHYNQNNEMQLTTKHYTIERNQDIERDIAFLIDREKDFWQYVLENKQPPLLLPSI